MELDTIAFFSKLSGLHFWLLCNYKIKIYQKSFQNLDFLFDFHKQCLLTWSLIYSYTFSPHNLAQWRFTVQKKSIYFDNWGKHNILVSQFFYNKRIPFKYENFCR